jgi:hypothetical protein
MFEGAGEVVILGLAIVVTWIVAWAVAERRVMTSVSDSYELQSLRARHRISYLENELSDTHIRPTPGWGDFEMHTVTIIDPGLNVSA